MLNKNEIITLKELRDSFLSKTDKCLLEDYEVSKQPISPEQKTEILAYRKLLKDLPDNVDVYDSINDVVFPSVPEWFKV